MRHMNGTEPKIEIFKPFGEAFELMKRILFQPFDVKKWFVIGFAAWLANLGSASDSRGGRLRFDFGRSRSHCAVYLAASTRLLHVYRLRRQEPRSNCRAMA